ncbi:DNA-binding response regulator, NarL/FixJ family, contains REC and HTH domains [Dyadobacter soli]|uniref:DNA-binding response regulator, NarL/FixJ family, contains REC and HTH domains n=1 Tax=Dyadobacter soli TaxID=659014 RepID=A0A1G7D4L4_9BACT|nr:hypothetical protein [Dyadobacter soli]SDE46433.1 DNA-binding response regulator, NarL/FixJ family, contains REC and HTH domains [Dyadobacter soli]
MISNSKREENIMVVVDTRTMYRAGIKSIVQSQLPDCMFLERDSFNDVPLDSLDANAVYFMIRIGNISDQTILNIINKARSAQKSCKIILYDYQQSIHNILEFFRNEINGYLPGDFNESELRECITSLAANRLHVNLQITIELMTANLRTGAKKKPRIARTPSKLPMYC